MACDKDDGAAQVGCPICNETGEGFGGPCEHCDDGYFAIPGCPRQYIGSELVEAINLASMSGKGDWPVAGGLLDQSAWFLSLKQHLDGDQNAIENEKLDNGDG